jgi:hypothetical protein
VHAIHEKVLGFIRDESAGTFDALALEIFAHQFECIAAYRHVCEATGATPASVRDWRDIPPVPSLAFKSAALHCGPPQRVFRSSGTTHGPERRSCHAVPDLRLYHAAAAAGLREFVFPDVDAMRVFSLIPSADDQPDSSLAQMVSWAMAAFGAPGSATFAAAAAVDFAALTEALQLAERQGQPVCLMTTTGTLIRFLDRCQNEDRVFRLAHGSRLMDTGGTKGAPRQLSRPGLLHAVWRTLAIPGYFVVNEYGMSELSSQYYDNVIRARYRGSVVHRAKVGPHWMRTRILDAATLRDVPGGEPGLLCHVDLANAGSALAVLTEDVGRWLADGFAVTGRAPGAEARGCSLGWSALPA